MPLRLRITVFFFLSLSAFGATVSSALLSPISKDHSTRQYTLKVYLKTPFQPTQLLLDLGASFSWVDCTHNYTSSTYHSIPCNSSLCLSFDTKVCSNCFNSPGPGCTNDSCALSPMNSVTGQLAIGQALLDSLALPTTDGGASGKLAVLPQFRFSCSDSSLLGGLAKPASGSAGLGRSIHSLPSQVSTALSLPNSFALCLSGSRSSPGVAFFGSDGPYYLSPGLDLSKSLVYTPLILNPVASPRTTHANLGRRTSDEYFIGVTSIKVNGKAVQFNETLLAIDENGFGGTKISTVNPYTVLHSSIYAALTQAFINESAALNLTVTEAVKPFGVCYSADGMLSTRVGPAVPTVDLVMHNDDVFWRIFGSNSMVRIARSDANVWCLGFADGGANTTTSIVIGGHQMEDNILQFDLGSKRLGFSSSILVHNTNCANFDFSTADCIK